MILANQYLLIYGRFTPILRKKATEVEARSHNIERLATFFITQFNSSIILVLNVRIWREFNTCFTALPFVITCWTIETMHSIMWDVWRLVWIDQYRDVWCSTGVTNVGIAELYHSIEDVVSSELIRSTLKGAFVNWKTRYHKWRHFQQNWTISGCTTRFSAGSLLFLLLIILYRTTLTLIPYFLRTIHQSRRHHQTIPLLNIPSIII